MEGSRDLQAEVVVEMARRVLLNDIEERPPGGQR
jgi:hypothetical protein